MEHQINIVASTFCLVATNSGPIGKYNYSNFSGNYNDDDTFYSNCTTPIVGNLLCYDNLRIELNNSNFDYYKKLFEGLCLIQLRDILYLLVPSASNWVIASHNPVLNTLPHVKMAISYIEKEISNNNINLVVEIDLLKNKYDELQRKLDLIINSNK
jgi:hypothetical protein